MKKVVTAPHARKVMPPSSLRQRPSSLLYTGDPVVAPDAAKLASATEIRLPKPAGVAPSSLDMSLFASRRISMTSCNLREQSGPPVSLRKADTKTIAEWDDEFDNFFLSLTEANHIERIESFVKHQLKAHNVIYWEEVVSVQRLISKRLHVTLTHDDGLVGWAFNKRSLVIETNAMENPKFSKEIDMNLVNPQATLIFIPLVNDSNQIEAIVEVAKKYDDPKVRPVERDFCELIQRKFKAYSKWFLKAEDVDQVSLKFSDCDDATQFMLNFHTKMGELFDCRDSEIWHYSVAKGVMKRYKGNSVTVAEMGCLGIVDVIVHKCQLVNCVSTHLNSSYKPEMDGELDEPLMGIPYSNRRNLVVVVVRGNKRDKVFTSSEERKFTKLAPFIANAFLAIVIQSARKNHSGHVSEVEDVMPKPETKKSANEVVDMVMDKLCKVTKAARGIFYVVEGDQLVSLFHMGWQQHIVIPVGKGHAGIVACKGIVMNVPDAYETEQWDPSYDLMSGFRTTSLLTVPIFSTNGNVIGVVQLFNKKGQRPFTTTDCQRCTVFGTYCSMLLDNSSLLAKWGETQRMTESLCNAILDLDSRGNPVETLRTILERVKQILRVKSVNTFYLDQASKSLRSLMTNEILDPAPRTHSCCFEKKEGLFINNTKHDALITEKPWYTNICLVPIFNGSSGECIGVFEAADKSTGFTQPDKTIMSIFAAIQGTILTEMNFKRYLDKGQVQIPMELVISEAERGQYVLPTHLKCADIRLETIDGPNYDSILYSNGMDLTKLVFYVFDSFGFLERFKITSEDFFMFLFSIEKSCSPIKFHNFIKEADNLQFCMYLIRLGKLDDIFSADELFTVFIAELSLYLKHDGTNDTFQFEASTPTGLLYKQSPLLTNAAAEIIRILQKHNCTLIRECNDLDYFWTHLIRFIMSTSRKEMKLTNEAVAKVKNDGPIDYNNTTHRTLALTVLFDATTFSHIARPLALCQKWFKLEQEEMFDLGDKRMEHRLVLKSRFTNREQSTAGLFEQTRIEKVGKPIYESLFFVFPQLSQLRDTVERNHTYFTDCVKAHKL